MSSDTMLSRVAECIFWMSRYVERAENHARMVRVNHHLSLESDDSAPAAGTWGGWGFLLKTTSADEFRKDSNESIPSFMAINRDNPNSIYSCISNARMNARTVRDQIPEELWLDLNGNYLYFQKGQARSDITSAPDSFYRKLIDFSLLFQGTVDSTVAHGESWQFLQLGRYLERADQTTRILDILTMTEDPDRHECMAILNACSAIASFRSEYVAAPTPQTVARFLLFSENFPRSIRFSLRHLDNILHLHSGAPVGTFSNDAERLTGQLLGKLNYCTIEEVFDTGLSCFIDDLQKNLNQIGEAISKNHFTVAGTH